MTNQTVLNVNLPASLVYFENFAIPCTDISLIIEDAEGSLRVYFKKEIDYRDHLVVKNCSLDDAVQAWQEAMEETIELQARATGDGNGW